MKAIEIPIRQQVLPPFKVDFADSFTIHSITPITAYQAAQGALGNSSRTLNFLMKIRNKLLAPFGIKTTGVETSQTRAIGIFPIIDEDEKRIVLGFDDKHLDFRITFEVEPIADKTAVFATTWVKYKNTFGRIYMAVIKPFHKRIVAHTLNRLAK